ncbi:MAG: MFS transporter [Desulfobacteraceae bacterium]|nr:MFS transporter [Desulfobacteraceae bacterium]
MANNSKLKFRSSPKRKIFFHGTLLFIVALGFNALFNYSTQGKLQNESDILGVQIIGQALVQDISPTSDQAPMPDPAGTPAKLKKARDRIEYVYSKPTGPGQTINPIVSILGPDGLLISSTSDTKLIKPPGFQLLPPDKTRKKTWDSQTVFLGDTMYFQQPVLDGQDNWEGNILFSFDKPGLAESQKKRIQKKGYTIIVFVLAGTVLLVFFLNFAVRGAGKQLPKKKCTLTMFLIIGSFLVLFSGMNTHSTCQIFIDNCQQKARINLAIVKEEIDSFLATGLTLQDFEKKENALGSILTPYPVLEKISIFNNSRDPVLELKQNRSELSSGWLGSMTDFYLSAQFLSAPPLAIGIHDDKNKWIPLGNVSITLSKDQMTREISNIIMNALTVVAISILFLIELLIFIFHFMDPPVEPAKKRPQVHYGLIRPVTFLFLFGIDISISFIPLHMETLYTPLLGLSRDTVIGLPISVEFFFVGIAIFLCGFWNDRRGWYEPFLTGLFLAGTGVVYSWLAPDVIHFILSRAVVGIGYGLTLLAAQGFVIQFSDEKTKARAFAQFISGLYAGSICGGATGALLAEQLGYRWVFCIGALILYSIIGYSLIFMRRAMIRPKPAEPAKDHSLPSGKKVITKFLRNRIVLSLIFLSSLPAAITAIGFLNYFCPIYLNRIGASQATIGRILMVYGFSLIYLGPVIGRFVDRSDNKKNYVFIGCILGSITFLMFIFLDGLVATTVAVFMLGLSNSYIIASQSTYLLKLKATQALGPGKAIGIFRATSRIGQALGPIIFSSLFLSANIRAGIIKLGAAYLLTAVLFLIFTRNDSAHLQRPHDAPRP